MNIKTATCGALATALFAAVPLGAMDTHFGVQAGLGLPTADLKDSVGRKGGFTVGGFALMDLGEGHALRPRLDFTQFKGFATGVTNVNGNPMPRSFGQDSRVTQYSLGADYLYYLQGHTGEGLYFLAGLGATSTKVAVDGTVKNGTTPIGTYRSSFTRVSPYAQIGLGYQFDTTFGLELRYTRTQFNANNVTVDTTRTGAAPVKLNTDFGRKTMGNITLAATVRF